MPRLNRTRYNTTVSISQPHAAADTASPFGDYLERVAKYVPAEIIALYLLIQGIVTGTTDRPPAVFNIITYIVMIGLTWLYLRKFGGDVPNKAIQTIIAMISFVIWTYGIGDRLFWPVLEHALGVPLFYPSIAGVVVVLWSAFTGLITTDKPAPD